MIVFHENLLLVRHWWLVYCVTKARFVGCPFVSVEGLVSCLQSSLLWELNLKWDLLGNLSLADVIILNKLFNFIFKYFLRRISSEKSNLGLFFNEAFFNPWWVIWLNCVYWNVSIHLKRVLAFKDCISFKSYRCAFIDVHEGTQERCFCVQ